MATTPAPITASPVAEVIILGTQTAGGSAATPCGNVFYYRLSAIVGGLNKAQLNTIFQTTVIVPLLAAANVCYAPNTVRIRMIDNATDPAVDFAAAGLGAIATDSEPSLDAVVCVMKSAFRGRVFRGFKHFGGSSEVDTLRDILVGAGLARWQTVRNTLFAPLVDAGGNTWTPFIFSRYQAQIKVNPTVVRGSDCTAATLNLTISHMKKRKARTVH